MSWDEVKSVSEPSYLVYILVEELDRVGFSLMEGCAKQLTSVVVVPLPTHDHRHDIDIDIDTNNDIDNDNNNTYSNKNMHKRHDIMRWRVFCISSLHFLRRRCGS